MYFSGQVLLQQGRSFRKQSARDGTPIPNHKSGHKVQQTLLRVRTKPQKICLLVSHELKSVHFYNQCIDFYILSVYLVNKLPTLMTNFWITGATFNFYFYLFYFLLSTLYITSPRISINSIKMDQRIKSTMDCKAAWYRDQKDRVAEKV